MSISTLVVGVYTLTETLNQLENVRLSFQHDMNVQKSVRELQVSIAESFVKEVRRAAIDQFGLTAEEKDFLTRPDSAGKIPAIKLVRERLNLDLRGAKRYVEEALVKMGYGYWRDNQYYAY
jgi:ribosomal protein L7/L12